MIPDATPDDRFEQEDVPHQDEPSSDPKPDADIVRIQQAAGHLIGPKFRKLAELADKRERNEVGPEDFELNYLFYFTDDEIPVSRKDLKGDAIVLTREEFFQFAAMHVRLKTGQVIVFDENSLGDDDAIVIYPDDLGDEARA